MLFLFSVFDQNPKMEKKRSDAGKKALPCVSSTTN